ncbi:MAG: hypothetical protein KKE31_00825, partial [Planctomycetes bacterium]|nr:hypothetical protein [Planctomycetota bacterium]
AILCCFYHLKGHNQALTKFVLSNPPLNIFSENLNQSSFFVNKITFSSLTVTIILYMLNVLAVFGAQLRWLISKTIFLFVGRCKNGQ